MSEGTFHPLFFLYQILTADILSKNKENPPDLLVYSILLFYSKLRVKQGQDISLFGKSGLYCYNSIIRPGRSTA